MKIKRCVLYSLLLALASYGLHYHVAKAFIHLAAFLSIINILFAIKDRSLENISFNKLTIRMVIALLISATITFVYFMIYNNPISERHFSSMFYPVLYFSIILPSLKIESSDKQIVLYTGIFSCIAMASSGIIDFISSGNPAHRTSGFLNMPIIYASCMVILTSWISAEFFKNLTHKKWGIVSLCFIAICAGFFATLFTGSRGPIIANVIVLVILFSHYLLASSPSNGKKYSLLIFLAFCTIITLFLSQSELLDNIKGRFQHGINNISTAFEEGKRQSTPTGIRLDMWEASLVAMTDHPLIGIGPGSYIEYFAILDQEKRININTNTVIQFDHMHNDFIQAWLSMGLIFGTMVLFFILYPTLLFVTKIKNNELAIIGLSICFGFILCGLTDVPAHRASSLTLFLLLICIQMATLNNHCMPEKQLEDI
ncbi:MAG: O-antigen ligase family protein [Oleispira sp.]|nr:O-antigen ligase family protein [Oleispira sp.]